MLRLSFLLAIFAVVMDQLRENYEKFKEWQVKPHEVAQLTSDKHVCATCHTEFHGNYCPRCGQKSTIGRYSFKTAFLTFLDVWGLGNRGMFRTIRDLLFRPGYMIRDYLSGMQMAYFPPFKMFFLVVALSVLVDSGLNIKMQNSLGITQKAIKGVNNSFNIGKEDDIDNTFLKEAAIDDTLKINGKPIAIKKDENSDKINLNKKEIDLKFIDNLKRLFNWVDNNKTVTLFLILLVLSGPMYFFFRKNKMIPDIRYSEFFVSMVYITNMMTIIRIIGGFFWPDNDNVDNLAFALSIIPLKQLYGYSYFKTLFKVIASFAVLIAVVSIIAIIVAFSGYLFIEHIL